MTTVANNFIVPLTGFFPGSVGCFFGANIFFVVGWVDRHISDRKIRYSDDDGILKVSTEQVLFRLL